MSLTTLTDVSPADWFVGADADPWVKMLYGPPGFEEWVRVPYDMSVDRKPRPDVDVVRAALAALARHTTTPEEVFVGIWPGWGWWPAGHAGRRATRFEIPSRDHVLLRVPIDMAVDPHVLDVGAHADGAHPHLIWPSDHAWFLASDVDPDWFAVGGAADAMNDLLRANIGAVISGYGEYLETEQ